VAVDIQLPKCVSDEKKDCKKNGKETVRGADGQDLSGPSAAVGVGRRTGAVHANDERRFQLERPHRSVLGCGCVGAVQLQRLSVVLKISYIVLILFRGCCYWLSLGHSELKPINHILHHISVPFCGVQAYHRQLCETVPTNKIKYWRAILNNLI